MCGFSLAAYSQHLTARRNAIYTVHFAPTAILPSQYRIISVPKMDTCAGGEHTLAKTADGRVFSAGACGLGWCRRLALTQALFGWRGVRLPEPAEAIVGGFYHNLALGSSGALYSWGCGTFLACCGTRHCEQRAATSVSALALNSSPLLASPAQEGGNDGAIPALAHGLAAEDHGGGPRRVPLTSAALAIAAGAYHSVVLTRTGAVLTFGAAQLGPLGGERGGEGRQRAPTPAEAAGCRLTRTLARRRPARATRAYGCH